MAKDCDHRIIDALLTAATTVHKTLDPGLLESIYERALLIELNAVGISAQSQVDVPISYRGVGLGMGFRLDLLIAERLVVEVKSVAKLEVVHFKQLLLSACN